MVKSLPEVWETWVRSLGWEDPLEKEMATHSTILAWKISQMAGYMGSQSQTQLSDFTFTFMNNSCYCSTKLHKEFLPLAAPTKDLIKRLPWWSSG